MAEETGNVSGVVFDATVVLTDNGVIGTTSIAIEGPETTGVAMAMGGAGGMATSAIEMVEAGTEIDGAENVDGEAGMTATVIVGTGINVGGISVTEINVVVTNVTAVTISGSTLTGGMITRTQITMTDAAGVKEIGETGIAIDAIGIDTSISGTAATTFDVGPSLV